MIVLQLAILAAAVMVLLRTVRAMRRLDSPPERVLEDQERINLLEHVCDIHDGAGDPVKHADHCRVCNPPQRPVSITRGSADLIEQYEVIVKAEYEEYKRTPAGRAEHEEYKRAQRVRPPWESGEAWVEEDESGRVREHNQPTRLLGPQETFGVTMKQAQEQIAKAFGVPPLQVRPAEYDRTQR